MFGLRKNVASQGFGFKQVSATTFLGLAGQTVTVKLSIDGAAQGDGGGVVTSLGSGQYWYAAAQADTNGNQLSFFFTSTGAVPEEKSFCTTAANPTDGVRLGLTALPNAAAAASGGLPTIGVTIPNATAGAAGGLFIAGSNAATTVNITGNVTGNLSGSAGSVTGAVGSVTGAVGSVTGDVGGNIVGNLSGSLTATERNAISDALLDRTSAIETAITPRLALRYSTAALAGVLSGAGSTTITIKGVGVATTRLTATVDADGDRSAVVLG